MKHININKIDWFLDDYDMAESLRDIKASDTGRRGYRTFSFKGRQFFLKSFKEKGLSGFVRGRILPRGKKEYHMGKRLRSLSILTPEPIGYGIAKANSFVIQELIDGKSLLDAFGSEKNREILIKGLARLLVRLKMHKIRHNDLHIENIIVHRDDLYVIDLHKMTIKKTFSVEDELSNISHSLAMVYEEMTEAEKGIFFKEYGEKDIREKTEAAIRAMRTSWVENKKARAFDETSIIEKKGSTLYMKGIGVIGDGAYVETIKSDKKTEILRYTNHIRKLYRSKRRLKRAWQACVVLAYMGLSITPRVYFLNPPSFFSWGFIAMEDLKGRGEELDRFLDRHYPKMDSHERGAFIDSLANFFKGFLRMDIIHMDLKGCNIFVIKENGFLLLDLEDIAFKEINSDVLAKMLIQLNTTIPVMVRYTDRMRFFLKVTDGLNIDRRLLARMIARRSLEIEVVYEGVGGLKREGFMPMVNRYWLPEKAARR
ncbi:MAG: hypothetical protein N3D15_06865 [Syntrophorhabdaceae bacterium]|nr:hypothetical protein [Syntrophorhabdaceae bacterium]